MNRCFLSKERRTAKHSQFVLVDVGLWQSHRAYTPYFLSQGEALMVENIKYSPNVYASELSTGTYKRLLGHKDLKRSHCQTSL